MLMGEELIMTYLYILCQKGRFWLLALGMENRILLFCTHSLANPRKNGLGRTGLDG